jgi:hypothetical protein
MTTLAKLKRTAALLGAATLVAFAVPGNTAQATNFARDAQKTYCHQCPLPPCYCGVQLSIATDWQTDFVSISGYNQNGRYVTKWVYTPNWNWTGIGIGNTEDATWTDVDGWWWHGFVRIESWAIYSDSKEHLQTSYQFIPSSNPNGSSGEWSFYNVVVPG